MIGHLGRNLERRCAVRPLVVTTIIAEATVLSEALTADMAIAVSGIGRMLGLKAQLNENGLEEKRRAIESLIL